MSKGKINKGSCNHYVHKRRRKTTSAYPPNLNLNKRIDRIVNELSEDIAIAILKKFRIV